MQDAIPRNHSELLDSFRFPNPKLSIRQDCFSTHLPVAAPNTAGVVRTQEAVRRTNRTANYFRRLLQRCGTNRGRLRLQSTVISRRPAGGRASRRVTKRRQDVATGAVITGLDRARASHRCIASLHGTARVRRLSNDVADIVGGAIRVAQQKTAAKLTIPIHDALHRVLSNAKRNHATILVTNYGEQFSVKGFGQMISAAIREAGLPERCKAARPSQGGRATPRRSGDAQQARSRRSQDIKRWPKLSAIRVRGPRATGKTSNPAAV